MGRCQRSTAVAEQRKTLRRDTLRYARLFPPGAERNRLRWIARSLTFFEEDPKGHAKQGRLAAEDRGPLMHAHVGMMLALRGAKPIPEYDPSKEQHWGRRKLKRDE
jgi:hypothetical protein